MNKYLSETTRKGITETEERVKKQLRALEIRYGQDVAICFICEKYFDIQRGRYPSKCGHCDVKYDKKFMYCVPDIIINNPNVAKYGVIFCNGPIHEKNDAQIKKDKYQVRKLKEFGFTVFVLKNEEVAKLTNFNLRSLLIGYYYVLMYPELYDQLIAGEKEIPSLR